MKGFLLKMKNKKRTNQCVLPIILAVCFAVVLGITIFLLCNLKRGQAEFIPPPFDFSAIEGIPEVPDSLGFSSPYKDGMGYRFSVCGNITMNGVKATVYLTNPEENNVWIKLRILDTDGNILGETGLVRPGEYVKEVSLSRRIPCGTPVNLKIMGYEPETYKSAGAVTLSTIAE